MSYVPPKSLTKEQVIDVLSYHVDMFPEYKLYFDIDVGINLTYTEKDGWNK